MMDPVDDDDDFIVKPPSENGDTAQPGSQPRGSRLLLEGFKRLVFAKGERDTGAAAEQEPILPAGFSAMLNAEEEEIYPADAKIRVLVAEGNLRGRGRQQAADLHQGLQQVVGTTAIYSHLIRKHKSGGTARRRSASDVGSEKLKVATSSRACGCGGESGPCKAISNLLREELAKITDAAEAERRGALLKRLRQAERRSGGLCNPAQLEREASSTSAATAPDTLPDPLSTGPVAPVIDSPRRGKSSWSGPMGALASAALASSVPLGNNANGALGNGGSRGRASMSGSSDGGGSPIGALTRQPSDMPWAENMLSVNNRTRYGAMLRARARDLAKRLSVIVPAAAAEMQAVAARVPPWEDEAEGDMAATVQQLSLHGTNKANHTSIGSTTANDRSVSGPTSCSSSGLHPDTPPPSAAPAPGTDTGHASLKTAVLSSSPPARTRAATAPPENNPKLLRPKAIFSSSQGVKGGNRPGPSLGSGGELVVVDPRKQRQDWKLSAQELSLINREEERVMPPAVLGKLLAAGAAVQGAGQHDFWDIFSRLEVATRTEALLNIALKGGKGCPARAGRMGRELCMSLTSVVLDAIAAVQQQQPKARYTTAGADYQPQQQRHLRGQQYQHEQVMSTYVTAGAQQQQQQRRIEQEKREELQLQKQQNRTAHLSLKKADARALQLELHKARNCKSGEIETMNARLPPRKAEIDARLHPRARVSPQRQGVVPRGGLKEDPGLSDLDEREGEFRQAIYVVRSALSGRLLRLTNKAPLCAEVLGSFVNDVQATAAEAADAAASGDSDRFSSGGSTRATAWDGRRVLSPYCEDDNHSSQEDQSRQPRGEEHCASPQGVSRISLGGGDSMSRRSSGLGSSIGEDTLLFECGGSGAGSCRSQPSPVGSCGSQVSPPSSMASTAPASDRVDEPTTASSSSSRAGNGGPLGWDQSSMEGNSRSVGMCSTPTVKAAGLQMASAGNGVQTRKPEDDSSLTRQRRDSTTAPNSPPVF